MRASQDSIGYHDGLGTMQLDELDDCRGYFTVVSDVQSFREPPLELRNLGSLSPQWDLPWIATSKCRATMGLGVYLRHRLCLCTQESECVSFQFNFFEPLLGEPS